MTEDEQIKYSNMRWKNRRRMAWSAMICGLGYPVLLVTSADASALAQIAMPFYLFVGSVVGAYIGFSTVDDKNWSRLQ